MSESVKPHYRPLNQPNFFLLERAKSELQLLYQIYFSRTNVRRRKSRKPNTPKNVLATSLSCNIIFYFLLIFLISEKRWKNTFGGDFCSIKSALSNGVLKVKFTLCFYTKIQLFLKETTIWSLFLPDCFATRKLFFWITFYAKIL